MAETEKDPEAQRLRVVAHEDGSLTMIMYDREGAVLGVLTLDNELAETLVDQMDDELEVFRVPSLANMRCLGTA